MGFVIALISVAVIAAESQSNTSDSKAGLASGQVSSPSADSFKSYSDHAFDPKRYTKGLEKGGHNLLFWEDPAANFAQYKSVRVVEFGGRLLPQQSTFSYDPYISVFNSTFRGALKLKLVQEESPETLVIEGAVVECNPGSRAARYLVGFGAGKSACAVVCEAYEPGRSQPSMRIYTRDTGSVGAFGGDSVAMLNHIMSQLGARLADALNTRISSGK